MQVSTDGHLMFGNGSYQIPLNFSLSPRIHLNAPVWTKQAYQSDGKVYCRVTQDRVVLAKVQSIISKENAELDYDPLLAVVITFNNVLVSYCNYYYCSLHPMHVYVFDLILQ